LRISAIQALLAALGVVAAVFHFWYAGRMPVIGATTLYFFASGALFLLGSALVVARGRGGLFYLGSGGLMALAAIDNALLYYTRTFGFGVLSSVMGGPPGGFRRPLNGTLPRAPFNGTGGFRPPPGGFRGGGFGWYSSLNPPGPVEFLALQFAVIAVAAVAILLVARARAPPAPGAAPSVSPDPAPPTPTQNARPGGARADGNPGSVPANGRARAAPDSW